MSKARLVITAIEVEGPAPAEVCAAYGVSRSWVHELLARYRAEGDTALQPRRVRTDKVDKAGCVTLRLAGRLHHIRIGRTHTGTHVLLLIQDLEVRVIDAATGVLLGELTIDPSRDHQPTGRPPGPPRKH
jgi:hypothetical protein